MPSSRRLQQRQQQSGSRQLSPLQWQKSGEERKEKRQVAEQVLPSHSLLCFPISFQD